MGSTATDTAYATASVAAEHDWLPLPEPRQRPAHRAVLAALGPLGGTRLLDVGCGVGLLLRAARDAGARVAGTDTAAEALEIACWALPEADLRIGGPAALPFGAAVFDVVTACTAMPRHGRHRTAALAELARVTRPGGRVVTGDWAHPAGSWAREFGTRLHRLTGREEHPDADPAPAMRATGLTVLTTGEACCSVVYRDPAAAWAAMLGSERLLSAIRLAGEHAVHQAFTDTAARAACPDGSVRLAKLFRFAVGSLTTPICYPV